MEKEDMTPTESLESLQSNLEASDAAVLISFKTGIGDHAGYIIPQLNMYNVTALNALTAQTMVQRMVKGRMEFVMLDYIRLLEAEQERVKAAAEELPALLANPAQPELPL